MALLVLLYGLLAYVFSLIKKRQSPWPVVGMRVFIVATTVLGIVSFVSLGWAVSEVASRNFYILAFGVPENFSFIFFIQKIFVGSLVASLLFFVINFKKLSNISVLVFIIFSCFILCSYLFYWGFI